MTRQQGNLARSDAEPGPPRAAACRAGIEAGKDIVRAATEVDLHLSCTCGVENEQRLIRVRIDDTFGGQYHLGQGTRVDPSRTYKCGASCNDVHSFTRSKL